MGLRMLKRQSAPVAWGGSEPQPWPPHPLLSRCSTPWESGWRWRWPSGTASMKRAAAKRCRWTRIWATSSTGAGQLTSRTPKRPCLRSRSAACWGWDEARGPLPAQDAGGPDRNPALLSANVGHEVSASVSILLLNRLKRLIWFHELLLRHSAGSAP